MAQDAKIEFSLAFNPEGLFISITGFNDTIAKALNELLLKFKSIGLNHIKNKIETQIEFLEQKYHNFYLKDPHEQADSYIDFLLKEHSTTPDEKLNLLEELDESNSLLDKYISNYMQKTRFEWVIQGNLTKEHVIEMVKSCHDVMQKEVLAETEIHKVRMVDIPIKKNYLFILPSRDPENLNSAIISYYQFGHLNLADRLKVKIISAIFSELFFDELRTKQALGYFT